MITRMSTGKAAGMLPFRTATMWTMSTTGIFIVPTTVISMNASLRRTTLTMATTMSMGRAADMSPYLTVIMSTMSTTDVATRLTVDTTTSTERQLRRGDKGLSEGETLRLARLLSVKI